MGASPALGPGVVAATGQVDIGLIYEIEMGKICVLQGLHKGLSPVYDPQGVSLGGVDILFFAATPVLTLSAKGLNGSQPSCRWWITKCSIFSMWHRTPDADRHAIRPGPELSGPLRLLSP